MVDRHVKEPLDLPGVQVHGQDAVDADPLLEGATYSILEEDEDRRIWRIDAYPTETAEADRFRAVLADFAELSVATEVLADATSRVCDA